MLLAHLLVIISPDSRRTSRVPLTKAKIRALQSLARKKDRDATRQFIVDGVRGVGEAIRSRFPMLELYYTGALLSDAEGTALVTEARRRAPAVHQITPREMDQISETVTAQGIVAVMQQEQWTLAEVLRKEGSRSVIVALDRIADPGNLGAIIRTCDWFGVDALLLGNGCVEPYNPKVVRSTVGSIFHLPILTDHELPLMLPQVKKSGYTVYATAADGATYTDEIRYEEKIFLMLGNEARGISPGLMQTADARLAIRRHGAAESLNVSVACGIVLAGIMNSR